MSAMWASIAAAAETWWPYVLHAAWQSALAGALVLVLARLSRRAPARLRYGLLLLVLLKFAIPPLIGVPYSVPAAEDGAVSAAAIAPENAGSRNRAASRVRHTGSVRRAGNAGSPQRAAARGSLVRRGPAKPRATGVFCGNRARHRGALEGSAAARPCRRCAVSGPIPGGGPAEEPAVFWRAATRRRPRRCGCVSTGCNGGWAAAATSGCCFRPSLCGPMALGALRPVIVLPQGMAENLLPGQLEAILAHEIAHHRRRRDLWCIALENLLMLVWWFHPVFWLARKALRSAREDCCDDMLLGAQVIGASSYCDTLLQAARCSAQPQWARAALGISDGGHPLGERIRRIMDTSIDRSGKLALAGVAVLAVLAVVLLPGFRPEARAAETAQAAPEPDAGGAEEALGKENPGALPTSGRGGAGIHPLDSAHLRPVRAVAIRQRFRQPQRRGARGEDSARRRSARGRIRPPPVPDPGRGGRAQRCAPAAGPAQGGGVPARIRRLRLPPQMDGRVGARAPGRRIGSSSARVAGGPRQPEHADVGAGFAGAA